MKQIGVDSNEIERFPPDSEREGLDLVEADMELSDDELTWCERYLTHFNPTRAAKEVFPESDHPSGKASTLKKNPHVLNYIKARVKERALVADEVLAQLAEIATSTIEDFIVLPEGVTIPFFDLQKAKEAGKLHLIKRIKYVDKGPGSRGAGVEVELYDRMQALEMIGRHLGMWRESEERVGEFVIKVVRE